MAELQVLVVQADKVVEEEVHKRQEQVILEQLAQPIEVEVAVVAVCKTI